MSNEALAELRVYKLTVQLGGYENDSSDASSSAEQEATDKISGIEEVHVFKFRSDVTAQ
jgi:hypothetical protein